MGKSGYHKYKINETYPDGSMHVSYFLTKKIADWNKEELEIAFPSRSYELVKVV